MLRKRLMTILLLGIALTGSILRSAAQGWYFTATLTYSGPCGATLPVIPSVTIPSMPDKVFCESLRQTIMSFRSSVPITNNQGQYIGDCSVFYTCSVCAGSDLSVAADNSAPGAVSIDGLTQGTAFFSPHESKTLENWLDDYTQKMESMGMSQNRTGSDFSPDIPLTGDPDFDKFYSDQTLRFEKPEQGGVVDLTGKTGVVDLNASVVNTGSSVALLTSSAEQKKRDDWMEERGLNEMSQAGADNTIDESGDDQPGRTLGDAAIRTAIGQAPGLTGAIGDFMVNVTDETISGISGIVKDFARGDNAQVEAKAKNLEGVILFNSAKKTAINVVSDKATEIGYCPLLKLVKGAEPVYKVAKIALDLWQNKKGE